MSLSRSLIHPRWWLKGPAIHRPNWQPRYPDDEPVQHLQSEAVEVETLGREIDDVYEQLHPEERARFRRQREAEHLKVLTTSRQYL
jgi:hypothetical protein